MCAPMCEPGPLLRVITRILAEKPLTTDQKVAQHAVPTAHGERKSCVTWEIKKLSRVEARIGLEWLRRASIPCLTIFS